ncbi:hypothetical protein BI364_05045 [Acidihalobacter yilgarnensis]|uniref:Crp/Fnr family transcriptional regulator n=1 Tax=Acidihalobacter yilgarnensis TaxID=2819280 RepID=A0A1D8ISV8_9GAMM|nr:Crp/Fnr family transcriptional regulator [Acidihalobacter yilgarnensis]AOU99556.1 hypothetical protein BI364_05045 [Acidihalobacter yilgarnensis]
MIENLQEVGLFATLDQRQIDVLARHTHRHKLERDEPLFHAGAPAAEFFLLRTGRIKLFMLSRQGEEKVMSIVSPGGTFAEGIAFMEQAVYPVSAQSLEASEVWAVDAATFRGLLLDAPSTCIALLAQQTRRIQGLLAEVEAQTLESAHYRLIAYLLALAESGDALQLPASKSVVAAHLAIKPETLSRLLGELQRRGLIEMHARSLRLLDVPGLRTLAAAPNLHD